MRNFPYNESKRKEEAMIRMLIPLVVLFLLYLLARTFLEGHKEEPIDVDPIDASSENGSKREDPVDDDIIDVEPSQDD